MNDIIGLVKKFVDLSCSSAPIQVNGRMLFAVEWVTFTNNDFIRAL